VGKNSLLGDFVNIYHFFLPYNPVTIFVTRISYMIILWDILCFSLMPSTR